MKIRLLVMSLAVLMAFSVFCKNPSRNKHVNNSMNEARIAKLYEHKLFVEQHIDSIILITHYLGFSGKIILTPESSIHIETLASNFSRGCPDVTDTTALDDSKLSVILPLTYDIFISKRTPAVIDEKETNEGIFDGPVYYFDAIIYKSKGTAFKAYEKQTVIYSPIGHWDFTKCRHSTKLKKLFKLVEGRGVYAKVS